MLIESTKLSKREKTKKGEDTIKNITAALIGALAVMLMFGIVDAYSYYHTNDIPVTVVVDKDIALNDSNWQNNTKNIVEFESRLITGKKVRFYVKDYKVIDFPAAGQNKTERDVFIGFDDQVQTEVDIPINEMAVVFTTHMPENLNEDQAFPQKDRGAYLYESYWDWVGLSENYAQSLLNELYTRDVSGHMRMIAAYMIDK